MFEFIYNFVADMGITGFKLNLLSAGIASVFIAVIVIIIGYLVNKIEVLQFRLLLKVVKPKTASVICNYFTFVGTAFHELSHALIAWFTGAKVTEVSLFEINSSGRLGHVNFNTTGSKLRQGFQLAAISCAPVITGLTFTYVLLRVVLLHVLGLKWKILFWYIIISIIDHMSMSNVDIKNYLKGIIVLFPTMFMISWFIMYFIIDKV